MTYQIAIVDSAVDTATESVLYNQKIVFFFPNHKSKFITRLMHPATGVKCKVLNQHLQLLLREGKLPFFQVAMFPSGGE